MKKSECRCVEVIGFDIPFITVASLHTVGYECRVPLQVEVLVYQAGPRQSRTQDEILLQPFANDLYLFEPGNKCFCSAGLVCLQVSKRSMSITSGDQKLCPQADRPIHGTSCWKTTGSLTGRSPSCFFASSFSCLQQRHS